MHAPQGHFVWKGCIKIKFICSFMVQLYIVCSWVRNAHIILCLGGYKDSHRKLFFALTGFMFALYALYDRPVKAFTVFSYNIQGLWGHREFLSPSFSSPLCVYWRLFSSRACSCLFERKMFVTKYIWNHWKKVSRSPGHHCPLVRCKLSTQKSAIRSAK